MKKQKKGGGKARNEGNKHFSPKSKWTRNMTYLCLAGWNINDR